MSKFRPILAVLLALVTVFMLNVGSVTAAKTKKPQVYTSEQLEQIKTYATDLQAIRDRFPELAALIQKQDWTFTRNFIHGPLGELRIQTLNLTRNLLPDAQPAALSLSKSLFSDLVAIDLAAEKGTYQPAIRNYAKSVKDLDAFLALVPEAARPEPKPVAKPAEKSSFLKSAIRKVTAPEPKPEPVAPEVVEQPEAAPAETESAE
jgi:photosystem II protein PsbQ